MRLGLVVPTLNAGASWPDWIAALKCQSRQPDRVLVIDSSSDDGTDRLAIEAGLEVLRIDMQAFDHGGTRQLGVQRLDDCEVVVCMTQDALLDDPQALAALIAPFDDPAVALSWGRQLPHVGASPIATHARAFNYPTHGRVVQFGDRTTLGLKAAFASNSFAAWRRDALLSIGGFPAKILFGEDMLCCARLLEAGWKAAYAPGACARHSHNYSPWQEFCRYVDIGFFHATEAWLLERFGRAEGEGMRFVLSEQAALTQYGLAWRLSALWRTLCKWLGYRVGRLGPALPRPLMRRLSMHRGWWR
ncbi:MAG: glycosyltransferase family 2 protein [Burkholderiales bacterium]|nr:glycosyltransferase family 2 protein [Burkholderiales bacterium]